MQHAAEVQGEKMGLDGNANGNLRACVPAGHAPLETPADSLRAALLLEHHEPEWTSTRECSAAIDAQAPAAEVAPAAPQLTCLPPVWVELPRPRSALQGTLAFDEALESGLANSPNGGGRHVQLQAGPASVAKENEVQQLDDAWPAPAKDDRTELDTDYVEVQPADVCDDDDDAELVLGISEPGRHSWPSACARCKNVHADGRRERRWVRSGRHWKSRFSIKKGRVIYK